MDQIYYAPNEDINSLAEENINTALGKLAAKVNIRWATHIQISDSSNAALLYMCNKVEAHILSLQLEANYEKLQNRIQKDALSKITNIITDYTTRAEPYQTQAPRFPRMRNPFRKNKTKKSK